MTAHACRVILQAPACKVLAAVQGAVHQYFKYHPSSPFLCRTVDQVLPGSIAAAGYQDMMWPLQAPCQTGHPSPAR